MMTFTGILVGIDIGAQPQYGRSMIARIMKESFQEVSRSISQSCWWSLLLIICWISERENPQKRPSHVVLSSSIIYDRPQSLSSIQLKSNHLTFFHIMSRRGRFNEVYEGSFRLRDNFDEDSRSSTQATSKDSAMESTSSEGSRSPVPDRHRSSRRMSLSQALTSPVRIAKEGLSLASPRRLSEGAKNLLGSSRNLLKGQKNNGKLTYEDLDIPPNATQAEVMAILLCRELDMIDL